MLESWTIAELAEVAAETLAAADPAEPPSSQARADGRVRDVPNERLVRWYVTVGLVDPPLSRRGRVARYGRRHLLQLVAVKRRQAEGRSLAEIQAELTGATDETLAAVARVLHVQPTPEPHPAAPARFWARQPMTGINQPSLDTGRPVEEECEAGRQGRWVAAARHEEAGHGDGTPLAQHRGDAARTGPGHQGGCAPRSGPGQQGGGDAGAGIVRGVRLAAGVTLLVEGGDRELGPEDLDGIIDAAGGLLEELARRRLRPAAGQVTGTSGELGDIALEGGHDH